MDIGISSAASGADPSISVRNSRSSNDSSDNGGFSDALSSAGSGSGGSNSPVQSKKNDDDDNDSSSVNSGQSNGGSDNDPSSVKSVKDVDGKGASNAPKVPTGLANSVSALKLRDDARDAATADAQDAADADAQAALDAQAADDKAQSAATGAKSATDAAAAALAAKVSGKKGDNADVQDATADAATGDTKTDTKSGSKTDTKNTDSKSAVSDALTLLSGSPAATSSQTAASVMAAAGMQSGDVMPVKDDDKTGGGRQDSSVDTLAGLATDAASTQDTDATTVKVGRTGGTSATFDLSVSGKSADAKDIKAAAAVVGGTPDVTVLDSRRYLGLAAGTNAATVLGTIGGNEEWTSAMSPSSALANQAAWTSTGKVVNTLTIQMNPENLGAVTATMRLSGDQLTVDLKVQSGEAYRQLNNDQSQMVDSLRSQGYAVDRITVTLSAPASTDSSSQSNFQGQSSQQQAMTNQGQGGEAQGRRQNFTGQQTNETDAARGTTDTSADSSVGAAQRAGSGGVYL